jgi:phytanoyl-CoA hydroxylase
VHLRGVLSPAEVEEIERDYNAFLRGEIAVVRKDLNDMTTGEHGTDPTGYAIVNVMLPRRYYPDWVGNTFEKRERSLGFTHSHNDHLEVLEQVKGLNTDE